MRNIDSKLMRPRTQFRFKYLAVRIRLLRLGGSLTTFSTVSTKSGHQNNLSSSAIRSPHRRPRGSEVATRPMIEHASLRERGNGGQTTSTAGQWVDIARSR